MYFCMGWGAGALTALGLADQRLTSGLPTLPGGLTLRQAVWLGGILFTFACVVSLALEISREGEAMRRRRFEQQGGAPEE
jgi:hypothetical protein